MDHAQRGQLREWAKSLSADGDSERRSSGRAILMLLDRIEELERRLHDRENMAAPTAPPEPPTERPLPDRDEQPDLALEDTQPIGLRDRLRLATGRIHQQ